MRISLSVCAVGLLGVSHQSCPKPFFASASHVQDEGGVGNLDWDSSEGAPLKEQSASLFVDKALSPSGSPQGLQHAQSSDIGVCVSAASADPELRRMCLLAVDHLPALYKRLNVEFEILHQLTPDELLSAVSEGLSGILAEEDRIADLVIAKKLPHGALPVFSLKQAIQDKLQALKRLKPKNITTQPGLMGLQVQNGKLSRIADCVAAQVTFFHDLMDSKFKLAKLTHAEVEQLVSKLSAVFSDVRLDNGDLPAALEVIAKHVMDEVAAPARAESLGAALQAMPPFLPVGTDNGLNPLSPYNCLVLVRGLFPTLRAHMTLHYEMEDPSEQQLQAMADVLLPILNAHRSRLRLSAQKGFTLLAPEEHAILWGYMEQFAREHKLVGKERPLNLWRFPNPAGAANILE